MDYYFEGIGNEFLLIVFVYLLCVGLLIKYFKLESCIVPYERIIEVWQSLRTVIVGDESTIAEPSSADSSNTEEADIRIFNTDCCVCLNEDYRCPVITECGHCFCGICAMNLIERCSVPMKCPLCRQECRVLFLPFRNQPSTQDDSLQPLVVSSVNAYNSRAEHRFPFVNRVRNAPVILRHLMRSFGAVRGHVIFRLKCHVVAAVVIGLSYLVLSADIIPERVFGLMGFLDDVLVLMFLSVLIARTYASLDSPITFVDVLAYLERLPQIIINGDRVGHNSLISHS